MPTSITTSSTIRVAIDVVRRNCKAAALGRPGARVVAVAAVLLLVSATTRVPPAWSDEPAGAARHVFERDPSGEGYRLFNGPLWLAGDATLTSVVPEHGHAFTELDDVSLLVRYELAPRLSLFSEVRLEETLFLDQGRNLRTGSGDLSIERLYADVLLTPNLSLRAGKLLTPFGLWNVIRRAPLSWTVERPPVTEQTYPQHTTGLSFTYQRTWHGWSFDATGYGPAQDELAFQESEETGGLVGGGRVASGHTVGPSFATLGLDGVAFEDGGDGDTGRWAQTYGADLEVDVFGSHLTGEFAYSRLNGAYPASELGFYVQDAVPIVSTLYGVVRFDYFEPRRGPTDVAGLVGVFWHPLDRLIVKLDYQFGNHSTDDLTPGLVVAVSLFF
jgi:hypothetical protein